MANIKSQKKRILITAKENKINNSKRSTVKNAIKKYNEFIAAGDLANAEAAFPETVAIIDKAKAAGILHVNAAARRVATITRSLSALRAAKADTAAE